MIVPWVMAVAMSVSEILRENIRLIAWLEKIRVRSFAVLVLSFICFSV
jgi:hypothetical protein